jgi:hypothetical protein
MNRVKESSDPLLLAMQKSKIPHVIVTYLKLQQTKNSEFFNLYLQKKINGRLFYNTCLPNGSKEIRYGDGDFLMDDFKNAIDNMLAPFNEVTSEQVKFEFVQSSQISDDMSCVIEKILSHIESSNEWKKFWQKEMVVDCNDIQKQQLYNLIATHAAYKVLVSCVDHSDYILDPIAKRNVTVLIGLCTDRYQKPAANSKHPKDIRTKKANV